MLERLYVKNVALIMEADIVFNAKLNVLSGETGSGKSVILDSINFVLGSKADRTMIRYGESEAVVKAEFSVPEKSEAADVLRDFDIECDGKIIISRKLSADGKSSVKINGNGVTASMLKAVTSHLVDVHGQSEHFFLLNEDNQLKVIDGLLRNNGEAIKAQLGEKIKQKRSIKSQIATLGGDVSERERKLDLLSYQINEIESAGVQPGEYDKLKERQLVLVNAEKIISSLEGVKSALNGDGGAGDSLSVAVRLLNGIAIYGEKYSDLAAKLEEIAEEAQDVCECVSDAEDGLSFDNNEAEIIDERLTLLRSLMKKYGGDESEILKFAEKAHEEYDILSDAAATVEKLEKELNRCDDEIYALCIKLTDLRKSAAEKFCKAVVEQLKSLNIPDARFEVDFKDYDRQTADLSDACGSDKLSFAFSANKGEPLKPLNKVISGGEMSRFMLALKTQLKDINGISTYIFDEIDAGISGYTAVTVAEKFKDIARNTQIIAVSHLAQVCAASDYQFLIYKTQSGGKTFTQVKRLTDDEKTDEIVRLTGNVDTAEAREHARQLIKKFKN